MIVKHHKQAINMNDSMDIPSNHTKVSEHKINVCVKQLFYLWPFVFKILLQLLWL